MRNISDIIEEHLKEVLRRNGVVEIQRSELAQLFQCVPSQINYVIATRFTLEKGYVVESKRGGGGYIRIRRIQAPENPKSYWQNLLELIQDQISQSSAEAIVDRLLEDGRVSGREALLMKSVLSRDLFPLPVAVRDRVRANILKSMLKVIFFERGSLS